MIPKKNVSNNPVWASIQYMEAELCDHKEFVAFMKAYSKVEFSIQIESEVEVEEVRA